MSVLSIKGSVPLQGRVGVHGSKNSVLPILAATILCDGQSVIRNCPELSDVKSTLRILRRLGRRAHYQDGVVTIEPGKTSCCEVPERLMRELRSSVVFLGAILAKTGQAVMSYPGGCELGPRPIDLHLSSLRQLGIEITEQNGNLICSAKKVHDTEIHLSFPSVGATENIMLYACGIPATTRVCNAAREPEIEDLACFLNSMGCSIRGAGSSDIFIHGTDSFRPVQHRVMPDRIVAATYLSAVAAAGGEVWVEDLNPEHLSPVLSVLAEAGCEIDAGADTVHIIRDGQLKSMSSIRTMPYPGFPTDAQAPIMAAAALAKGTTVFVENIFESRFRHAGELVRMGADIQVEGHVAVICGVPKLYGTHVGATDLRGGAALAVAALGAKGETIISGLNHIDRGYDKFEENLRSLGARIERVV
ncbi:MAG: UDP-N-acetylglucosamine 1-carboxyvinyltransferase [Oscillospiraceae bacterium]|nr:UDP-N-acetylglucosamine 1-carboxyvinyltransferase [Oscillospiraceae bacterium]